MEEVLYIVTVWLELVKYVTQSDFTKKKKAESNYVWRIANWNKYNVAGTDNLSHA